MTRHSMTNYRHFVLFLFFFFELVGQLDIISGTHNNNDMDLQLETRQLQRECHPFSVQDVRHMYCV